MGYRGASLILALLGSALPLWAQVPAQATVLALRATRASGDAAAVAFDVRDGRGAHVPGVAMADVKARTASGPLGVQKLQADPPTGTVWVLDATRRARMDRFSETQQAFALWADSLRAGAEIAAVVAAGQPPRLVQGWTADRTTLRAEVDNLSPRSDEADLTATLRLAAETCRTMPAPALRCAIVFITDARDAGASSARLDSSAQVLAGLGVPIYAARLGPDPGEGASSDALARLIQASRGVLVTDVGAVRALRRLRTRLSEGYLMQISGLPMGRAVDLEVAVRTADGRTLQDSASVYIAAPAPAPDTTAPPGPVVKERSGSWKVWVGLLSLLIAGGAAWLFFGRRNVASDHPDTATETPPSPVSPSPATPQGATVTSPALSVPVQRDVSPPPLPTGASLHLTLRPLRPNASPMEVVVGDRVTLGRTAPPADVALLEDAAISATHLALERHGTRVLLRDLGSTNGTAVNGVPVQGTVVLEDGDIIRLGETDLRVHYPST